MLSCEISNLYSEILEDDNLKLWNKVKNWKNVKFITEKDESVAIVKGHQPKIVLSSSGFCTNGRILSYLHEYLSDDKSMVIFSGYVGDNNSYLSYRIKNYKENKFLKISGDIVENKADCISLLTFSSHANRDDLIEYGSSIQTEKLILVHGSTEAKNSLKEDLKKAISKKDKTHKVLASSKDMYLKL
jgi:metallo-beta-lactamase family protein